MGVERVPVADPRRVSTRAYKCRVTKGSAIVSGLVLSALAIACGGGEKNEVRAEGDVGVATPVAASNLNNELTTGQPTVTSVPEEPEIAEPSRSQVGVKGEGSSTPGPSSTSRELRSLFESEFKPTSIGELRAKIADFYQKHPEFYNRQLSNGAIFPETFVAQNLNLCEKGDPVDVGAASLIAVDRSVGCSNLINAFHDFYRQTGAGELYELEIAARNYYFTEYPARRQIFDDFLRRIGVR